MLTLGQKPHAAPSLWQYRLSRFMLSRAFWRITRVFLPFSIALVMGFQLWTSNAIHSKFAQIRDASFQKFASFSIFTVEEVVIKNATQLREEEIRAFLDIETPQSILNIDREEMRQNLSQMDAVGFSDIRFNYSGTLVITLEARVPTIIFYDGSLFETVDASGHRVEGLADRSARPMLFVMSGEGAKEAVEEASRLVKMLAPLSNRVRGLVRVGGRRWDVVFTNGSKLMLPSEGAIKGLQHILREQASSEVLNRDILAFDMRNPNRPILRMSEAANAVANPAAVPEDVTTQ